MFNFEKKTKTLSKLLSHIEKKDFPSGLFSGNVES